MTGYYLTFNNGRCFELYVNLKLGSKKLKQQDWFMLEPQTMSFDLMYFDQTNSTGESTSNRIINEIFVTGVNVNGLIRGLTIKLYLDSTLLFTGIVDLTQSKYSEISKKATVTCYDYIKLISVLKDNDKSIVDNRYSYSDYLVLLQSALDELSITDIDVHSSGGIPNAQLDPPIVIDTNQQDLSTDSQGINIIDYSGFAVNATSGSNYLGLLFYVLVRVRGIIFADEPETVYFRGESILMSFDGVSYERLINRTKWDNAPSDSDQQELNNIAGAIVTEFSTEIKLYLTHDVYAISLPNTFTFSGLTYILNTGTGINSTISITGSMFSYFHTTGKYLKDGYNVENETNIISVLKLYLMANNQICYADSTGINITGYNEYQTTHVISDNDIDEIDNNYIDKKEIEKIPGIDAETEYWLKALNIYYSGNISTIIKNIGILFAGNENIKAGDRITNATYNLDIFLIELKHNIGDMTITVTGV